LIAIKPYLTALFYSCRMGEGSRHDKVPASQQWTGQSRLAEILRTHPDALRRLSSIDPGLSHLDIKAASLTDLIRLEDLAQIAGLPVEALIAVLTGEATRVAPPAPARDEAGISEEEGAIRLDVRPVITAGQEPFAAIMKAAAQVGEGGMLLLDAPFDPAPLRRVLAGKGFTSQGRHIAEGHWRIAFRRGAAPATAPAPRRTGELWAEADGAHLDVRGLEPPEPLVKILSIIDSGRMDALTVHHERDPVFLYPELEARGWVCRITAEIPGEVRLKLSRRK
jgi:hypothetical protein